MNTREIPLPHGHVAIVDAADYDWLMQWKWQETSGYARRTQKENGKYKSMSMHRILLSPLPGFEVDHVNGNTLDNRRCNLRVCTRSENNRNVRKPRYRRSSQYKGVHRYRPRERWSVTITSYGKKIYLGRFDSEVEAAHAYDIAVRKIHGAFARLNFPTEHDYTAALTAERSVTR